MPHRNGTGIALLADPTRRRIVAMLAMRPHRPSVLARQLSLSRPAIARQLRLLEEAELVMGHRVPGDGRAILYTINARRHGAITAWLAGTEIGRTVVDPAVAAGVPGGGGDSIAAGRFRGRSQEAERSLTSPPTDPPS